MDVVHFDFEDRDGRRLVTLREAGVTKSVRAKIGPAVLVAKVFDCMGAFDPRTYAALQKAAQGHGPESVSAPVRDPGRLAHLLMKENGPN